jgi:YVTN family beta-propeller protein
VTISKVYDYLPSVRPSRRLFLLALILLCALSSFPAHVYGQTVVATIGVGDGPTSLAFDSAKGEIFVANSGSNTVSVISDITNTVVASVSVGSQGNPVGLVYDSARGVVFVTISRNVVYGNSVSVINDTTNTLVGNLAFGQSPLNGIAYDSGKGELFVASPGGSTQVNQGPLVAESGSTIYAISDANGTVLASVDVGPVPPGLVYNSNKADTPIPSGMAYDSGKGEIFVTNYVFNYTAGQLVSSTVSVVSDLTNTVVATVNIGGGTSPEGLAYDPAKGEVFVVNSNGTTVSVISDATNSIVANVRVEPEPAGNASGGGALGVAYDAAKGEIFVANGWDYLPNTVSVISDESNKVVSTVSVGYGPSGLAYDSAKGEVFVANEGANTVSVISDNTSVPEFPSLYALPIVLVVAIGISIRTYALMRPHGHWRSRGLLRRSLSRQRTCQAD